MQDPEAVAWLESEGMEEQRAADSGGGFGIEVVLQHCAGLDEMARRTEEIERRERLAGLPDFKMIISGTFDPKWADILRGAGS